MLLLGGGLVGGEWDILVFGTLGGGWGEAMLGLLVDVGEWCQVPLVVCGRIKEGQKLTFGHMLFVRFSFKTVLSEDVPQLGV